MGERVVEMRLCEAPRAALQPDVLHRFTVDVGCDACVAALADYNRDTDRFCVKYRCTKEATVVESSDDCPENPLCAEHATGDRDRLVRRLA